jgi:hypothetical protein
MIQYTLACSWKSFQLNGPLGNSMGPHWGRSDLHWKLNEEKAKANICKEKKITKPISVDTVS